MILPHGFYAVEWEAHRWADLVRKLRQEGKLAHSPERMGLISLLRKVKRREQLPKEILVLNFDHAMYDAFWLNGGEARPEEAQEAVQKIVRSFGKILAQNREWLQRQSPVILILVKALERRVDGWWIGYRFASGNIRLLFRMEQFVPNPALLEPKEVLQGVRGCFAPF